MSMVSIKNFVAPFTNTVHAVTIILVTVLFALFRLGGGGVSASYDRGNVRVNDPIETYQSDSSSLDSLIPSTSTAQKAPAAALKAPAQPDRGSIEISAEQEDLIKQMIGRKPFAEEKPQAPVANKPANSGGLDEIEKSLGMR